VASNRFLYVFLDEAGNLSFDLNGTRYFSLTSITLERPFYIYQPLADLKYDLMEAGLEIEYFHASEDAQQVRDKVFQIIGIYISAFRIDSLIIEKRKTGPALQTDEKFYPKMVGYLLRYVLEHVPLNDFSHVFIITDRIPLARKKKAIEKAIKTVLAEMLPEGANYRIFHHDSKSNFCLQMVDYCNWAIYRKWDRQDMRSYVLIQKAIKSEFDIFRKGATYYY
jgi:Protein of unknown function (DUF3800)